MTPPSLPEFSRMIPLGDVSRKDRTIKLRADRRECDALCRRFGLIALNTLEGTITYSLSRTSWIESVKTVDISGSLTAHVVQSCIITSDDVATAIHSEFTGILAPVADRDTEESWDSEGEGPERPEILGDIAGDSFDPGEILATQMSLELNPFPRKPDVSFDGYSTESDNDPAMEKPNPFAVLAKLKDNHR